MTGTSLDGLDAALVRITGTGLDMSAEFVGMVSLSLDKGNLGDVLRRLAAGEAYPPIVYMRAARQLGELHADAVERLLREAPIPNPHPPTPDFIVAHGQTIWHAPKEHLSWQLFDPWPVVQRLGVPVCYDLRRADLIAGGEGAPITPIADRILYSDKADLIFNLGGICNYTCWSFGDIEGGDVTVCNILLDGLVSRFFPGSRFDFDGTLASKGTPQSALIDLIGHQIGECKGPNTTLGREQFGEAFLNELMLSIGQSSSPEDVLASAIEAIVNNTDELVEAYAPSGIVLAGGGARNPALVASMRRRDTDENIWHLSDDLGIPCEAREAMGFAVLGVLARDGVDITLPQVTGRDAQRVPRAGAWVYPKPVP